MQRGERHAAKERGDRYYNTGKPCANGHLSHRYTQSGACCECLKFTATTPVERVSLPVIKVRAYHEDREVLAASALLMAVAHEPHITDADSGKPATNVAAGTGMYGFKCHNSDQDALRELAASLIKGRHIDTDRARNAAIASAVAIGGPVDTTPPINFN